MGWLVVYFTVMSVFQISGMICEQWIGNCPEVFLNKATKYLEEGSLYRGRDENQTPPDC
jgi:hypothetical protein